MGASGGYLLLFLLFDSVLIDSVFHEDLGLRSQLADWMYCDRRQSANKFVPITALSGGRGAECIWRKGLFFLFHKTKQQLLKSEQNEIPILLI